MIYFFEIISVLLTLMLVNSFSVTILSFLVIALLIMIIYFLKKLLQLYFPKKMKKNCWSEFINMLRYMMLIEYEYE